MTRYVMKTSVLDKWNLLIKLIYVDKKKILGVDRRVQVAHNNIILYAYIGLAVFFLPFVGNNIAFASTGESFEEFSNNIANSFASNLDEFTNASEFFIPYNLPFLGIIVSLSSFILLKNDGLQTSWKSIRRLSCYCFIFILARPSVQLLRVHFHWDTAAVLVFPSS